MVDRAWARRFFPNESAVGKRLRSGGCTDLPVDDGGRRGERGEVRRPRSTRTTAPSIGRSTGSPARFLMVRTQGDPLTIAPSLQQAVRELEPAAPLSSVATMSAAGRSVAGASAVAVAAGRQLRGGGAAAVGDRHLRRDGLLRAAAPQGDQHPHGARRQPRPTSRAWWSARA